MVISVIIVLSLLVLNIIPKKFKYNNPIVPEGFRRVETEFASWQEENGVIKGWNDGLVIEDEQGNQFVWVPVDNQKVKYEKDDRNKYLLMENVSVIDDILPTGINNEMDQIKKYGGFYIARYEAGVPNELQGKLNNISNETNNIKGVPVSKQGIQPWNYISYVNAKSNAESMYSNLYIQSGLITGTQWDTTLEWLLKSNGYPVYGDNSTGNLNEYGNSSAFGNYGISEFTFNGLGLINNSFINYVNREKSSSESIILATGIVDRNKSNNIYDLAGNLQEFTTENDNAGNYYITDTNSGVTTSLDYYIVRGGSYESSKLYSIASLRNPHNKVDTSSSVGFRVVLYIK